MQSQAYAERPVSGFACRRVHLRGVETAVWERRGAAPSVVFVHGNSASKAAFRDVLEQPALEGRQIVACDLPGSGESSDATDAQYTMPAFARILRELIRRLELQRVVVVGWSLGGHIAIEAVGQDARAFDAMVLTGTPPSGPGGAELLQTFRPSELMSVATGESPPPELLDQYVHALYGDSRAIPPELFAAARRCHGRMRRLLAEHWVAGTEGLLQRRVIADWQRPIAVIQGRAEPFFDPTVLNRLPWKNLWRGESQFIDGAGHAPFFEKPDVYADLLVEFLRDSGV